MKVMMGTSVQREATRFTVASSSHRTPRCYAMQILTLQVGESAYHTKKYTPSTIVVL